MSIRIGINGFGRIGRNILRAKFRDPAFDELEIVALNDPTNKRTLAHLYRYDSVQGTAPHEVEMTDDGMRVAGGDIRITGHRQPADIPWDGIDYIVEASGHFAARDAALEHLTGDVRRVVITAPATGDVRTVVMGVNEETYNPRTDRIISNASCTTNCLAPIAQTLHARFGIKRGLVTTVHAYTNDQSLLDSPHGDLRRARAAGISMIPTMTGASAAIGLVIPELRDRFDGLAIRVPTPNVSLVDAVMELEQETSTNEVNQILQAATNRYLGYCDEPLVSIDFQGDSHSSIVDGGSTRVLGSTAKVLSWYDNEYAYACRVLDIILYIHDQEQL